MRRAALALAAAACALGAKQPEAATREAGHGKPRKKYGKPYPETMGAIAAGTTLGWLALKHRSVWLGVAVHFGVALSMDILAIRARGIEVVFP